MLIVFIILFCVFLWGCLLLCNELHKKFDCIDHWLDTVDPEMIHKYEHPGSIRRRMGNIVIQSRDGKPFSLLVCVKFYLLPGIYWGVDPYGMATSSQKGSLIIKTYLGKCPVTFIYIANRKVELTTLSDESFQWFKPHVTHKPHLIQWLF